MKMVSLVLDVLSFVWVFSCSALLLLSSVFLFDSPNSTLWNAWVSFATISFFLNIIPLIWWWYRISNKFWFNSDRARVIFSLVAIFLLLALPLIYWTTPLGYIFNIFLTI